MPGRKQGRGRMLLDTAAAHLYDARQLRSLSETDLCEEASQ